MCASLCDDLCASKCRELTLAALGGLARGAVHHFACASLVATFGLIVESWGIMEVCLVDACQVYISQAHLEPYVL